MTREMMKKKYRRKCVMSIEEEGRRKKRSIVQLINLLTAAHTYQLCTVCCGIVYWKDIFIDPCM